ncbi:histidinol-phosphate transaminase [Saxibacter everestensis]|uniref:Histidinol-phosphate aminotransferase n=1 Tax=Saxibacter everestensis TaxID=2909229 RepID=A0ABY8QRU1_9MICO|nr:histidinol-phosphate transaminase [Brevibacteriaceae bacterium ZFBP1038]
MHIPKLRKALDAFPPYIPGKAPQEIAGLVSYKISSNESYLPPLPSVIEAITEAAATPARYPDTFGVELVGALGVRLNLPTDHFIIGTGSSELINSITQATCDDGDEAIYAWPSFEMYPQVVGLAAAKAVEVPLTEEFRHDLPAMADAITERTRLIFLCTPNNPTGPAIRSDELEEFLGKVPPSVIVVLDEAYLDFITDPDAADGLDFFAGRNNVVLLRTFSKAHGLAGMRIGFAVARPNVIEALTKTVIPFGVTSMSQKAALASLRAEDEMRERVCSIVAERNRVRGALLAQGWNVPDSQANFIWLPLGELTDAFDAACRARALSVRNLDVGVRCTIAEPEASDRLIEIADEFRKENF